MNRLGNYVRERRVDLGLTQEELAARIGGTASQAEVSRLERGTVAFPRRNRMEALAAALEVTLGALLVSSGWLESDEVSLLEDESMPQPELDSSTSDALLADIGDLRERLLSAIELIGALEEKIQTMPRSMRRPDVSVSNGVDDDGEKSVRFEASRQFTGPDQPSTSL